MHSRTHVRIDLCDRPQRGFTVLHRDTLLFIHPLGAWSSQWRDERKLPERCYILVWRSSRCAVFAAGRRHSSRRSSVYMASRTMAGMYRVDQN